MRAMRLSGPRSRSASNIFRPCENPICNPSAEKTGLSYAHLDDADRLSRAFESAATPQYRAVALDLRPFLGAAAGVALIALYIFLPVFEWLAAVRL